MSKARLLPVHLEGPHLAPSKAGAQNPKLMSAPGTKQRDWILSRARSISQMTIAPELQGALQLIHDATRAGITMSAGHTEATDEDMRAAVAVGLTKVTHLFNAMSTASKRGLFRQAGALEFALSDEKIFCELVADISRVTYATKTCLSGERCGANRTCVRLLSGRRLAPRRKIPTWQRTMQSWSRLRPARG